MTPNVREEPRISLNKLGEYLVGEPRQRRRILRDQKYPSPPPLIYYEPVTNAVAKFFDQGGGDDQIIFDAIEELEDRTPDSRWKETRRRNCILALESFLDTLDNFSTSADSFQSVKGESAAITIAGVEVSIRPEVLVLDSSNEVVGAVKLYLGKDDPLEERPGKLVATMLYLYLTEEFGDSIQQSETSVVDIFDTSITTTPRSHKRRKQDLIAACREIAAQWSGIQPNE